jgi:Right handed beta helix region
MPRRRLLLTLVALSVALVGSSHASPPATPANPARLAGAGGPRYSIGSPTLADIWVNPVAGSDDTSSGPRGASRATAFQTLLAAWQSIPEGSLGATGYRIRLTPGEYRGAYLEGPRYGTAQFPIMIEPSDGPGTVTFVNTPGDRSGQITIVDARYVYLQDFSIRTDTSIPEEAGDAFQCERCEHLLLRRMTIRSLRREAQTETIKINQSQHIYIEDSHVIGAGDNALDMVAVQYGHIARNTFSDAADWCAYVKGGSAYIRVEANHFTRCGTGGFTVGQGTGFQFMTPPWLHYEAYDIKVVNNLISEIEGAGLGVNGGYNVLLAHNTLFRVGQRSHAVEFLPGRRGCDGGRADLCQPLLNQGGWGSTGDEQQFIPNRNVFFYNNVIYNPAGVPGPAQVFDVRGPVTPPPGSNVPSPALSDENLRIRGNLIWVGDVSMPLGIEDAGQGCQPGNATCTEAQLRADNTINTAEPQLADPAHANFQPLAGGNLLSAITYTIPDFGGGDLPSAGIPGGELTNSIPSDYLGISRASSTPPGAFATGVSAPVGFAYLPYVQR